MNTKLHLKSCYYPDVENPANSKTVLNKFLVDNNFLSSF